MRRLFPPEVALELMRLACQMPEDVGRSLAKWDCSELASELVRNGTVKSISAEKVRVILASQRLKPWRSHYWLRAKTPRDAEFVARTQNICDLYTRELAPSEIVLSCDEKTSLQPRTRLAPTKPAQPGSSVKVEHEYVRKGALNLFAAFDTRTGRTYGRSYARKRQKEFIDFLEHLDTSIPASITLIHIICDNVSTHHGKEVRAWLLRHPRFRFHFTPVHCSWMNQVEQWFSILQRKRLTIPNFADLDELRARIDLFIEQWNETAAPFKWNPSSFDKALAKAEVQLKKSA